MADRSGIEWTDATWNPIVGCSLVSPGCTHCYAIPMARRIEAMAAGAGRRSHYDGTTQIGPKNTPIWTGKVALAPDTILTQPLRWRRPRRIFVNSMGDLFHESLPDEWIDRVFAIMALCPQHTFQVLTKRSARMRGYFAEIESLADRRQVFKQRHWDMAVQAKVAFWPLRWPLPNVWLGVSTEDQRRADERVPDLLATPAAIRFVSAEPLLGMIDFRRMKVAGGWYDALSSWRDVQHQFPGIDEVIDQIIVGGESGPHARPMHPDWARSLRDQCAAAGTAFFFKQWGSWEVAVDRERDDPDWRLGYGREFADEGATKWLNLAGGCGFHGERFHVMRRVSKHAAGRLLDGVEHNAMPEVRA